MKKKNEKIYLIYVHLYSDLIIFIKFVLTFMDFDNFLKLLYMYVKLYI